MIPKSKKHLYQMYSLQRTPFETWDRLDIANLSERSFVDSVEGEEDFFLIYRDNSDAFHGVISTIDSEIAVSEGLGYYRTNKDGEKMLVFTKTGYPRNFKNLALYELVRNKNTFPIDHSIEDLRNIAREEVLPPYEKFIVMVDTGKIYLIARKEYKSTDIFIGSGKQHQNYQYWEFNNEQGILYKYKQV